MTKLLELLMHAYMRLANWKGSVLYKARSYSLPRIAADRAGDVDLLGWLVDYDSNRKDGRRT